MTQSQDSTQVRGEKASSEPSWYAEARALRAAGLPNAEIARRVGRNFRTVSDFFRRPACPECSQPMSMHAVESCAQCRRRAGKAAYEARLEDIALMWEEGMLTREINQALGYGPNSSPPELAELRRRGRIEYRYLGAGLRETERRDA